ncbi:hypothetical protein [Burkholderia ubonensis]|uniref:hypothetical protein n=1 Tax=Burkholderia ubonensis TaxID=101571 RepID=UPI0007559938|nr:hypothetical protein [Burkholderia ubonensis]KVL70346.1 hypothetical protein WJ49_22815 [Burkholderia ubonensis]KVL73209.1 hypothetical protein WJ48_00510 [Burkholderia ubonensis]KVL91037.1 hypothetical protein WJ50_12945 [Burkholderia ubonensis]
MDNLFKFLRNVSTPRNVVWLALTLLLEFGWGALLYALPQFVPDVQVPLLLLMGLMLLHAGLALLGFAVIPVLVGFAVDEVIARLCPAKEQS